MPANMMKAPAGASNWSVLDAEMGHEIADGALPGQVRWIVRHLRWPVAAARVRVTTRMPWRPWHPARMPAEPAPAARSRLEVSRVVCTARVLPIGAVTPGATLPIQP